MRFEADGPAIPGELLEARDRGDVVFFCGAGVSMPAGLPSFAQLAARVADKLGADDAPDGSEDLDRVFNRFQQDYRRAEVEVAVNALLRTPRRANLTPHLTILRLSRGTTGRPRVVTTNFDRMFERAHKGIQVHVAPALPDIHMTGGFDGLVYLHGRSWQAGHQGADSQLVLSSSDFGRAYLADGWATRFAVDLLETYAVVLVGYQAEDPPVRYLLEGLNSRRGDRPSSIYALVQGTEADQIGRWRGRGVRALPYTTHEALWRSLSMWADRADDPDAWRQRVVSTAQRSPRELAAYQRGQVVELVRTAEGAASFARAQPPPPAEWLCVFDRYVRRARPSQGFDSQGPDPLNIFGLDDDPPRTDESTGGSGATEQDNLGLDLLASNDTDRADNHRRLAGTSWQRADSLPERLTSLAGWFGQVAHEPVALWWAAGYGALHPRVLTTVEWRVRNVGGLGVLTQPWQLLLERFRHSPERHPFNGWYQFESRLKQEGWTSGVLRDFERVAMPHLRATRASERDPIPPFDLARQELDRWVRFSVDFPASQVAGLEVSSEVLPEVFEIGRRGLARAASLLREVGQRYWTTSSFTDSSGPGVRYLNDASKYFHWLQRLFVRLADEQPAIARHELRSWPLDDEFFFAKLAIHSWMRTDLLDSQEVADNVLRLSDACFWHSGHRRELLHTLRARWSMFDKSARTRIEFRLLAGRPQQPGDPEAADVHREASASMLRWLELSGCELSTDARLQLESLISKISGWRDAWAASVDDSQEPRAGSVAKNVDPSVLLESPLRDVANAAEQHTREDWAEAVRYEPFEGLVEQKPRRALAALSVQAKRGLYPVALWRTLLGRWPKTANVRLTAVCAGRLAAAPDGFLSSVGRDAARWYRDNGRPVSGRSMPLATRLFDRTLAAVLAVGEDATTSYLGERSIGGRPLQRSRQTFEHAINSPIGHLSDGLISVLDGVGVPGGVGVPAEIARRFIQLLNSHGEGGAHAACLMAFQANWLFHLDPAWTESQLLALFGQGERFAEACWNGLVHSDRIPSPRMFGKLRQEFFAAFEDATHWAWDQHEKNRLVDFLLETSRLHPGKRVYPSPREVRVALRLLDEPTRSHALWSLARIAQEPGQWRKWVRRFFKEAWPREIRFQTPQASGQLAHLAQSCEEDFPDAVSVILPFVVPTEQLDLTTNRMAQGGELALAKRFPAATLDLLDRLLSDVQSTAPYDLGAVLDLVAAGAPSLKADRRWRRLRRISERG